MTQINLTQLLKNAHSGDKKADIVEFALISVIASSVRSTMRAREVGGPDTVLDVDLRINGEECDFSYLVLSFARKLEDGMREEINNMVTERLNIVMDRVYDAGEAFKEAVEKVSMGWFGETCEFDADDLEDYDEFT